MLPLFTICDRWDVGGVSTVLQAETGLPTIVIHDAYPGGAGLAELAWASAAKLLDATRDLIAVVPVRRRVPVVRAVAEVRQRQRPARQGRCARPGRRHPRRLTRAHPSTVIAAVAVRERSGANAPTMATSVGST